MTEQGLLVVISGPSGTGKGTVIQHILEHHDQIQLSISATTRQPREGDIDGVHYHFLTKAQFEEMIARDAVLEYATYCDQYYGTPKAPIENWRSAGDDVILEIEVQGGAQVKQKCPDCVTIFILPPSREELENRLRGRGTEEEEKIQKRLQTAKDELQEADRYDYTVVNTEVADTAERIMEIIQTERKKRFAK